MEISRNHKRTIVTVVLSVLSFPLLRKLTSWLVQPKDYVPEGEKGTEMVTGLGSIFVLTILIAVSLIFFYMVSGRFFKKDD